MSFKRDEHANLPLSWIPRAVSFVHKIFSYFRDFSGFFRNTETPGTRRCLIWWDGGGRVPALFRREDAFPHLTTAGKLN